MTARMSVVASSVALAAAIALGATNAHAGDRAEGDAVHAPTSYWLEARPYTCSQHLPALAREITLACDAAGGVCGVASSEATATRYLVFHCAPPGSAPEAEPTWTIVGTDDKGARRWSADLAGPVEDRLRAASVWVVRAEGGEATARPVTLPSTPLLPRPAAAPDADASDVKPAAARGPTITFSAHGAVGYTSSAEAGSVLGTRVMFGGHLIPELVFGVGGSVDRILDLAKHTLYPSIATSGHGGLVLGLGAPFDAKSYGVLVEAGPGFRGDSGKNVRSYWYVRGALNAQLSPHRPARPFASLSFTQNSDEAGLLRRVVSLDLGFAWSP